MRHTGSLMTPHRGERTRRPHSDTLTSIRVALRADPAGFDPATIAAAISALSAVLCAGGPEPSKANAISQAEAARLLSCSRWSIRRLVDTGKLRPVRLLGGLVRYDRREVEGLLSIAE